MHIYICMLKALYPHSYRLKGRSFLFFLNRSFCPPAFGNSCQEAADSKQSFDVLAQKSDSWQVPATAATWNLGSNP